MVIGWLKKALLAMSEVGAMEMMGEETREVVGSSGGNPKHIWFVSYEGFNLECRKG